MFPSHDRGGSDSIALGTVTNPVMYGVFDDTDLNGKMTTAVGGMMVVDPNESLVLTAVAGETPTGTMVSGVCRLRMTYLTVSDLPEVS